MARIVAIASVVLGALAGVAWLLTSGPSPISVTNVRAVAVADAPSAMVTLDIRNDGPPDLLIDARSSGTKLTVLKSPNAKGLPVPAGSSVSLAMEAGHIMLMSVEAKLAPGAALPLEIDFERAGTIAVKAVVAPGMMMHGAPLDIDPARAPELKISAKPSDDGWEVLLETTNFTFARDLVDGPHVAGTGHAHLYVSGIKVGRLYEPRGHIGPLPRGDHEIEVVLNTNDHRAYAVDGEPIAATLRITAE